MHDHHLVGHFTTLEIYPHFAPTHTSTLRVTPQPRTNRFTLQNLPLPPTFPHEPQNRFTMKVVGRFGIFSWDTADFLVIFYNWGTDITESDIHLFISSTEGSIPHRFSLCPMPLIISHIFKDRTLQRYHTKFTTPMKRWLVRNHPPYIAGGFIDRAVPLTHRIVTPSHTQLWMKL